MGKFDTPSLSYKLTSFTLRAWHPNLRHNLVQASSKIYRFQREVSLLTFVLSYHGISCCIQLIFLLFPFCLSECETSLNGWKLNSLNTIIKWQYDIKCTCCHTHTHQHIPCWDFWCGICHSPLPHSRFCLYRTVCWTAFLFSRQPSITLRHAPRSQITTDSFWTDTDSLKNREPLKSFSSYCAELVVRKTAFKNFAEIKKILAFVCHRIR